MGQKVFFKNLDAFRFAAFVLVFLYHALDTDSELIRQSSAYSVISHVITTVGMAGFSLIFVISSYINTWVILTERERAGRFSPWRYYVRRAIRIWPLYFLTLFIGFVIAPAAAALIDQPYTETANPWYFLLFIGNFFMMEHGWPHSPIISVLWVVSVEEQFYLLWPLLLVVFRDFEKWLIGLLLLVFVATTFYYHGTNVNIWFHTLFLCCDIAAGALFAFISFERGRLFKRLQALPRRTIVRVYAVFGISLIFYAPLFDGGLVHGGVIQIIEKFFYTFLLGFFIFEQNFCHNSFLKFGRWKSINYLGLISYGLYCFHVIGLLVANQLLEYTGLNETLWAFLLIKPMIAFAIIFPLAHVSWRHFEERLLRLKGRFYSR